MFCWNCKKSLEVEQGSKACPKCNNEFDLTLKKNARNSIVLVEIEDIDYRKKIEVERIKKEKELETVRELQDFKKSLFADISWDGIRFTKSEKQEVWDFLNRAAGDEDLLYDERIKLKLENKVQEVKERKTETERKEKETKFKEIIRTYRARFEGEKLAILHKNQFNDRVTKTDSVLRHKKFSSLKEIQDARYVFVDSCEFVQRRHGEVTIRDISFKNVDFNDKYFTNVKFYGCHFEDVNFSDIAFSGCLFNCCTFKKVNFSISTFDACSEFDWVKVWDCNFHKTHFAGNAFDGEFIGCDFDRAVFSETRGGFNSFGSFLIGARFIKCRAGISDTSTPELFGGREYFPVVWDPDNSELLPLLQRWISALR